MIKRQAGFRGFTLIELVIVMTIVGILAAIAFPSYQNSVRNSRRATAATDLLELAQWMERRYSLNNTYLDNGAAPALPFVTEPRQGGTVVYNFSFSNRR